MLNEWGCLIDLFLSWLSIFISLIIWFSFWFFPLDTSLIFGFIYAFCYNIFSFCLMRFLSFDSECKPSGDHTLSPQMISDAIRMSHSNDMFVHCSYMKMRALWEIQTKTNNFHFNLARKRIHRTDSIWFNFLFGIL